MPKKTTTRRVELRDLDGRVISEVDAEFDDDGNTEDIVFPPTEPGTLTITSLKVDDVVFPLRGLRVVNEGDIVTVIAKNCPEITDPPSLDDIYNALP